MHKIKLVIFDLDGVLVKTDHIHTQTLKTAIEMLVGHEAASQPYVDSRDGTRTVDKLAAMQVQYALPLGIIQQIDKVKQSLTLDALHDIQPNSNVTDGLLELKSRGFKLALASNSRRQYVDIIIKRLGIDQLFHYTVAGDEVHHPKPNPECFKMVMAKLRITPQHTIIFEDSNAGLEAARASGATVVVVNADVLVTREQIMNQIN